MRPSDDFWNDLYREKQLHKEHRHTHVMRKLLLSSSFFGISQLDVFGNVAHLFLYIVPPIAIIHDLYIFGEDYKVKRIGLFIQQARARFGRQCGACAEELFWEEEFLPRNRDPWAFYASLAFTALITVFAAIAAYYIDFRESTDLRLSLFWLWLISCACLMITVFGLGYLIRWRICPQPKESNKSSRDAAPASSQSAQG